MAAKVGARGLGRRARGVRAAKNALRLRVGRSQCVGGHGRRDLAAVSPRGARRARTPDRAVGRGHHTEAAKITDIRVPGRRRSKAVPLELSDYGCQVASMTKALENKKELEEGHVILAVNGEPTDGAQDARRALRNAFDEGDELKLEGEANSPESARRLRFSRYGR